MSHWPFNVYMDAVMKEDGDWGGGNEISVGGKRVEIAWPLVWR